MAGLRIVDLRKRYGTLEIIHGVSFDIKDGEFCVFVGPSGCGKSTILRMIAGLEAISGGEIWIGNRKVNALPPKSRDIAMVFQNYALYPHMTVAQNIGFPLRMRGDSASTIAASVAKAAAIIGLGDLLDRYPRQLSGGQRQRVAMGRAIVRQPKAFLFDEPLSNLDAKLRIQMRTQLKELHQRLTTTTVYVTHDQVEAMTLADRIVVLKDGRVEQIGAPLELYDQPENLFVASFIGSPAMNLIEGAVVEGSPGQFALRSGVLLPLPPAIAHRAGSRITYGVRPEDFELVAEDTAGSLALEVAVIEPSGSETMVLARGKDLEVTATFRDRPALRPGERIWLRPILGRVHLFGASPGSNRIGRLS